jgi:hypothetical protein
MEHYIGDGSTYDVDMELIESFIKAKDQPENIIAQAAVFTYYISRLYNYWDYMKDNLNNYHGKPPGDIFWDVKNPPNTPIVLYEEAEKNHTKQFIIDNFSQYEQRFLFLVGKAQEEFQTTSKLNMSTIFNLFKYVGSLMCLEPLSESIEINSEGIDKEIFILPNGTGFFGFNSYLYAYIQGVYLLGMPRDDSTFDEFKSCPLAFLGHDILHSLDMGGLAKGPYFSNIYYTIIAANISKIIKELIILVIWTRVHEFVINDFLRINPGRYYQTIMDKNDSVELVRKGLDDEFNRFSYLFGIEENQQIIVDVFSKAIPDIAYKMQNFDNYEYTMLFGYAYIILYILPIVQV